MLWGPWGAGFNPANSRLLSNGPRLAGVEHRFRWSFVALLGQWIIEVGGEGRVLECAELGQTTLLKADGSAAEHYRRVNPIQRGDRQT